MTRSHTDPPGCAAPYAELSIYYLQGRVPRAGLEMDPGFIGNWEEDGFSFLFFSEPRDDAVERLLGDAPELRLLDRYAMSYEEWLGERFVGFDAGCFRVRPPWAEGGLPEPPPGDRAIVLDPGVVFGTGTHPTTRDCLLAIELVCRRRSPRRVLDLGTGSGLLAIAAARMGAEKVAAVDLNPLAARTALRNVRLNGLEERVCVVHGRAEELLACPADLLVANLHHDVMGRLVDSPAFPELPCFILSGLLRGEVRDIEARLSALPVRILHRWDAEATWFTLMGESASPPDPRRRGGRRPG